MSEQDITGGQARLRNQLRRLCQNLNKQKYEQKNHMVGKVLTITDGITADPDQRKAIKNIVQDAFWGDSVPGGYEPITHQIEQLAKANGFELWEPEPPINYTASEPNEYEKVN